MGALGLGGLGAGNVKLGFCGRKFGFLGMRTGGRETDRSSFREGSFSGGSGVGRFCGLGECDFIPLK